MAPVIRMVDLLARSYWLTLVAVVAFTALGVAIGKAASFTTSGAISLYFVVWWTVLFAILPVRIQSQVETGEITPGTDPGAPANPALLARTVWTSIASTIVFGVIAFALPLAGL